MKLFFKQDVIFINHRDAYSSFSSRDIRELTLLQEGGDSFPNVEILVDDALTELVKRTVLDELRHAKRLYVIVLFVCACACIYVCDMDTYINDAECRSDIPQCLPLQSLVNTYMICTRLRLPIDSGSSCRRLLSARNLLS